MKRYLKGLEYILFAIAIVCIFLAILCFVFLVFCDLVLNQTLAHWVDVIFKISVTLFCSAIFLGAIGVPISIYNYGQKNQ